MRIVADKGICVGAGQCVLTDPGVFDQSDDDGTVIILEEHPADLAKAEDAVHVCPSQALSLVEE